MWVAPGRATGALLELYGCYRRKDADLEAMARGVLDEVVSLAREGADRSGRRAPLSAPARATLGRAEALIDGDHPSAQDSTALAKAVGVHPVYLARLFRRCHGVGISGYRRRRKVRSAIHRLAAPGVSLSEVAHSLGFSDQSHFGREFKGELGITPGRYRRLVHGE